MKVNQVTKHAPWVPYKTISATKDALGTTEKKASGIPSDAFIIPESMTNVELRVSASVSGRSGVLHIYAARMDDDISHVGSIAMISGAQVSSNEKYYVHSMTPTDRWITEVKIADANANDGMSRVAFDGSGYDVVFAYITFTGDTIWYVDLSGFA